MNSFFSWLDYSEHDRQKMLEAIAVFGERTTRDELGIGVVRDIFADVFFPGISTIQTSAKYFLLVPWTFQLLEQKGVSAAKASQWTRNLEIKTSQVLAQQTDTTGVIGRRAGESLRRLPSSVYWQGLGIWGIRLFEGFPPAYYRSLDPTLFSRLKQAQRDFDGDSLDRTIQSWDPALPPIPNNFPESVRLKLSGVEAEYLREKVLTKCSMSMLAVLLRRGEPLDDVSLFWEMHLELPSHLEPWVQHGRLFSESMHGAQLLYNLILSELTKDEKLIGRYRRGLSEWQTRIQSRFETLSAWRLEELWSLLKINSSSRPASFIHEWVALVKSIAQDRPVAESNEARLLVTERERQLKGSLARINGGQSLSMWRGDSGAAQLDLRWRAGRRIARDILEGLEENSDA